MQIQAPQLAPSPAVKRPALLNPLNDQGFRLRGPKSAQGSSGNPEAREAAEQLVASALLMPLLKEARNSTLKGELFHGGRGEEAFGQQLDTILADRMVQAANFPLVDRLVQTLTTAGRPQPSHTLDQHG